MIKLVNAFASSALGFLQWEMYAVAITLGVAFGADLLFGASDIKSLILGAPDCVMIAWFAGFGWHGFWSTLKQETQQ